jgi:hypothetical protein
VDNFRACTERVLDSSINLSTHITHGESDLRGSGRLPKKAKEHGVNYAVLFTPLAWNPQFPLLSIPTSDGHLSMARSP